MTQTTPDLPAIEAAFALLAARDDFRVLRRLEPHDDFGGSAAGPVGSAIVLDTETTGTDLQSDQVIELAMLRIEYALDSGAILRVVDSFEGLEDPGRPIPPESTKIHGITDAMVAGKQLDEARIGEFTSGSPLVIAHNAYFDRTFLELRLPLFAALPWACSYAQLPWRDAGFGSAKLEYLCWRSGFFYDAHRGGADCRALLELLSRPLPGSARPAIAELVSRAEEKSYRLWAVGSPFETKDKLKTRGYRWDGERRCWSVTVGRDAAKAEAEWLKAEVYGGRSREIEVETLDAHTRFSNRSGTIQRRPV